MLEKYKVMKEGNEDVLYLYITMGYEFSQDLDQYQLEKKTRNWLCNQRIQFNGNKVVLVVDGMISKVMTIDNTLYQHDNQMILLENNQTMSLQDVLLSLLLTNIKMDLPIEALKSVVILYRSEVLKLQEEKQPIKRFNKNFAFISADFYKLSYPNTYKRYEKIYKQAIEETSDHYLTYQGKKIEAYIHTASNGYTETKKDCPYLIKKESFWDFTYPYYLQITHFSLEELRKKLNLTSQQYEVSIINISHSNRIESLKIGNTLLSSINMMTDLGLPSSDATILVERDGLTFVTRGVGHGYGLSLWGARSLANLGCNALQILGYYFDDIILHR